VKGWNPQMVGATEFRDGNGVRCATSSQRIQLLSSTADLSRAGVRAECQGGWRTPITVAVMDGSQGRAGRPVSDYTQRQAYRYARRRGHTQCSGRA
jgi:hypothetical protein